MKRLALAALAATMASPALAAPCGPIDEVLKLWAEKYSETPAFQGQAGDNSIMITISPAGGWTIFGMADGTLCELAGGEHWQTMPVEPEKPAPGSVPEAPALLGHGIILIRR